MKLFEYFAVGKPVLSTTIEELKNFPQLVFISDKPKEWKTNIDNIFSKPWPLKLQNLEKTLAKQNSWENKVSQILNHARDSFN